MIAQLWVLLIFTTLLASLTAGRARQSPVNEYEVRAAIARSLRSAGYEVTERRAGSDGDVTALEQRDSTAYNPASRMLFRVRSLQPWAKSPSTYFRYWLVRETYPSQEAAAKRAGDYLTGYHERLATERMSRHMVSKTILRVAARQRGSTVYLLVTDGLYTLDNDTNQARILDGILKAKNT